MCKSDQKSIPMSFLLCPDDQETLAEALAFIDAYDPNRQDDGENSAAGRSGGGEEDAVKPDQLRALDDRPLDKREKAKKKRSNAFSSARLRVKKKAEMTQLQERVMHLQLQLQRLQCRASIDLVASSSSSSFAVEVDDQPVCKRRSIEGNVRIDNSSVWLEEAVAQSLQRKKSETLNAQLKTLLGKQVQASRALDAVIQKLPAIQRDVYAATGSSLDVILGPSLRRNDASPMLEELRGSMELMYKDIEVILESCGAMLGDSVGFNSQIKRDAANGSTYMQLTSSTPMACDLDTACPMIWDGMQLKQTHSCKFYIQRLQVNVNSMAKSYLMTAHDGSFSTTLHGVAFMRKFEEPDRMVYIWTTAIVPPRQKGEDSDSADWWLRFREKGWIVISRTPSNPEHESIFRTCYQVYAERRESPSSAGPDGDRSAAPSTEDLDRLCSCVLNALSADMRMYTQLIQNKLLAEVPVSTTGLGRLLMV
ncbi:hypothetical protein BBJ28_00016278 [Nothophytophthora sp. Chile5]|nr:hypothetical protein BBJ28_00016278 [Nothophytophthora sp. Chile5]